MLQLPISDPMWDTMSLVSLLHPSLCPVIGPGSNPEVNKAFYLCLPFRDGLACGTRLHIGASSVSMGDVCVCLCVCAHALCNVCEFTQREEAAD